MLFVLEVNDSASDDPRRSPAVQSLRREQAGQKRRDRAAARDAGCAPDDELCLGLAATFPASDPVSATASTISGEPRKGRRSSRVKRAG